MTDPRNNRKAGFTLIELMVVIAIIALVASLATISWRSATSQSVRSLAVNTLTSYLTVARSYAMANQIETMLVVNPYDGRLELWRANPPTGQQRNPPWDPATVLAGPAHPDDLNPTLPHDGFPGDPTARNPPRFPAGGAWDVQSTSLSTTGVVVAADGNGINPIARAAANGYAFVPILDTTARLPIDGNGKPRVMVFPIDFAQRSPVPAVGPTVLPPGDPQNQWRRSLDNLLWTAFCFDLDGRLVVRARRIDLNQRGDPRSASTEFQPRTALLYYSVDAQAAYNGMNANPVNPFDTLLLSTPGFVVVEREAANARMVPSPLAVLSDTSQSPQQDVGAPNGGGVIGMLTDSLPGGPFGKYAEHILLDQWSGRPLQTAQ